MSGLRRLAVLISAVWLAVVFAVSESDPRYFGPSFILAVGVAPVALAWGVAWVVAGFRRR
jgi:hypothetical protein